MKQQTLAMAADASSEFAQYRKPTRRDEFLKTMDALVPWSALYDSASLRRFVGIDLGREPVPDATTMLKFRRLLERNNLGQALFARVGGELQARGIKRLWGFTKVRTVA